MQRERSEEREVVQAVRRAFVRGPFSAKCQSTPDVPEDRIAKWSAGDKPVRAWEVRQLLPELMRADPAATMAFLDELLGLRAAGLILAAAPLVEGVPFNLVVEAAEAGAAVGAVQALVLAAGRDGVVSAKESQEIRSAARHAERELAEVAAVAARAEAAHFQAVSA